MERRPIDVVEAVYAARKKRDITATMALCHPAIVFTFNVDPDKIGSGNTYVGVAASIAHLERVAVVWEQLTYEVKSLRVSGDEVHASIAFSLRYRKTGQVLVGTKRQVWTVRHGLVTQLSETLDREYIQAFMRMTEAVSTEP